LLYAHSRSKVDPELERWFARFGKRLGGENGTDADIDREKLREIDAGCRGCVGIVT
jgi:hypothetical protein